MNIEYCKELSNHTQIPFIGFGLYNLVDEKEFKYAVNSALEVGYRHFDTASIYRNEEMLGNAIKENEVDRREVFITTKLWKSDFGYHKTLKSLESSLRKIDTNYVDLYLIHWPQKENLIETWKAFEHMYHIGKTKAIGVSNFTIEYLNYLIHNCEIKPMVNQIEHHPFLLQKELVNYCFENGIQIIAHSPLMWGNIAKIDIFNEISIKYNKTPSQIILRWNIQKGIPVIPKSSKRNRIIENFEVFDFSLDDLDMKFIDSLDINHRIGGHPASFNI